MASIVAKKSMFQAGGQNDVYGSKKRRQNRLVRDRKRLIRKVLTQKKGVVWKRHAKVVLARWRSSRFLRKAAGPSLMGKFDRACS